MAQDHVTHDSEAADIAKNPFKGNGVDPRMRLAANKSILRAEYERMAQEKAAEEARLESMTTEELRASLAGLRWEPGASINLDITSQQED